MPGNVLVPWWKDNRLTMTGQDRMSPALGANGLRPAMSRVAVGLPCPGLTVMKALPSSVRSAMRFGRSGGEPARLRGGSSAWHLD
jgi:hypothetical protein